MYYVVKHTKALPKKLYETLIKMIDLIFYSKALHVKRRRRKWDKQSHASFKVLSTMETTQEMQH